MIQLHRNVYLMSGENANFQEYSAPKAVTRGSNDGKLLTQRSTKSINHQQQTCPFVHITILHIEIDVFY